MSIEDRLKQKREAVNRELERLLSGQDSLLHQAMRYAVLSEGKRFRPLLVLSSAECFGVSQEASFPAACALEFLHNYSLIHDDLPAMDDDDFRRGKPSCHKAFGEDIALLAGDALLTLAFEILASAPVSTRDLAVKVLIIEEVSRSAGVDGMIGGQLLDIKSSPDQMTEESMTDLMLKKTGSLISAAVKVGALLGKASQSQMDAMVKYGKNIGLAFQIRDDILDYSEDTPDSFVRRPNSAAFYRVGEARLRMKKLVTAGIQALDEASLKSEELRFLARKLIDIKDRKDNE